jgi:hypothetical protein
LTVISNAKNHTDVRLFSVPESLEGGISCCLRLIDECLSVLVHLEFRDHDVRGMNWNVNRFLARLLDGNGLDIDAPRIRLTSSSRRTGSRIEARFPDFARMGTQETICFPHLGTANVVFRTVGFEPVTMAHEWIPSEFRIWR